ncbi:hypothetical protein OG948_15925 [Embleya sp. NBC_00888]|uniref:hypothetical protein n=1 Tax=Embleya sp. NBC_00888 TaxID=2975960 RepID=UPI00386A455B|nr:hypothetical protein OG948_15925 [Embleya sp. NBC_00888]
MDRAVVRPRRVPSPVLVGVVLGVVLCAASAGCTASDERADPAARAPGRADPSVPPPLNAVPPAGEVTRLDLPIAAYLPTPEQRARQTAAEQVLIRACLGRLGLTYPTPATADTEPVLRSRTERRYGVGDPVEVAGWGFRPPGAAQAGDKPSAPALGRELEVALYGAAAADGVPPAPTEGSDRPGPGCLGEARFALGVDPALERAALPSRLDVESFERSRADPRVRRVLALWSTCMRGKGFDYPDPLAAGGDPAWDTPVPSAREIAAATATVACRAEHNVAGIWYAVDVAYQRQAIEREAAALTRVRAARENTVRKVAEVLGG